MASNVFYMVQNAFWPLPDTQSMVYDDPACPEGILSIFSEIENLPENHSVFFALKRPFEANFIFELVSQFLIYGPPKLGE